MTRKEKPSAPSRREFFKAAGIGAAAAAVGAASGAASKPAQARETKGEAQGYRLTEHVKRYYDLAKY
jgi:nitrous oxide reductase